MSLRIHLEHFEGPMGLLLHLIREQEMDIFDIDIAKITQQYLDYIKIMKTLDLEVAGDFVAMAATLLQIKSRMLLPSYNEQGEAIETEDPRKELVQKLLEYQKYQEAANLLRERSWVGRDVWLRGERLTIEEVQDDEVILDENPLFALISSYRQVVRAMKSGVHKVVGALQSIAARIIEMGEHLQVGVKVPFSRLIQVGEDQPQERKSQVLVTFLSLLELAKMGFISLFQADSFSEIHIEAKKPIDRDVVTRVESYDNAQAEAVANEIMASANHQVEMFAEEEPGAEISPDAIGLGETLPLPIQDEGLAATPGATDEEIEAEIARLDQMEDSIPTATDSGLVDEPAVEAILANSPEEMT